MDSLKNTHTHTNRPCSKHLQISAIRTVLPLASYSRCHTWAQLCRYLLKILCLSRKTSPVFITILQQS